MSTEKPAEGAQPAQPMRVYRNPHVTEADSYGMGYPEAKDRWPTQKDVEERMALDPDYTPNHDGRIYMIV